MKYFFLRAGIALSGCAAILSGSAAAQTYTPRVEPCACPIKIDSSFTTHCGYLVVPENRSKPGSPMIRLPYVYVDSKNPKKPKDPILYTAGGPGGSSLGWAAGVTNPNYVANHSVILHRDCIAFEQRGTRYAIPYLRRFELDTAVKEAYRKNLPKDSMWMVGVRRYKQRLESEGIDLSGYNTAETVADIIDLLTVLHIDSVNLFGGSYSGGLMMAVLQKAPDKVRSLVLDSPLPMFSAVDEDEPAHFNEALDILFRYCERDSSDRYHGLKEKFRNYFTSIIGKVFYMSYLEKGTRDSIKVAYDKNDLLQVIEENLLDYTRLKDLPALITEIIRGNHRPYIQQRLDDIFNKNTAPDGMRISVYCADQATYHSEEAIHSLYKVYPYMEGYHINDVYGTVCDAWGVPPVDPMFKQAFYSAKPALLADGEMDPACCPLYIEQIHHYMPNSQRFVFPHRTHGCGGTGFNDMKNAFLDHPYQVLTY